MQSSDIIFVTARDPLTGGIGIDGVARGTKTNPYLTLAHVLKNSIEHADVLYCYDGLQDIIGDDDGPNISVLSDYIYFDPDAIFEATSGASALTFFMPKYSQIYSEGAFDTKGGNDTTRVVFRKYLGALPNDWWKGIRHNFVDDGDCDMDYTEVSGAIIGVDITVDDNTTVGNPTVDITDSTFIHNLLCGVKTKGVDTINVIANNPGHGRFEHNEKSLNCIDAFNLVTLTNYDFRKNVINVHLEDVMNATIKHNIFEFTYDKHLHISNVGGEHGFVDVNGNYNYEIKNNDFLGDTLNDDTVANESTDQPYFGIYIANKIDIANFVNMPSFQIDIQNNDFQECLKSIRIENIVVDDILDMASYLYLYLDKFIIFRDAAIAYLNAKTAGLPIEPFKTDMANARWALGFSPPRVDVPYTSGLDGDYYGEEEIALFQEISGLYYTAYYVSLDCYTESRSANIFDATALIDNIAEIETILFGTGLDANMFIGNDRDDSINIENNKINMNAEFNAKNQDGKKINRYGGRGVSIFNTLGPGRGIDHYDDDCIKIINNDITINDKTPNGSQVALDLDYLEDTYLVIAHNTINPVLKRWSTWGFYIKECFFARVINNDILIGSGYYLQNHFKVWKQENTNDNIFEVSNNKWHTSDIVINIRERAHPTKLKFFSNSFKNGVIELLPGPKQDYFYTNAVNLSSIYKFDNYGGSRNVGNIYGYDDQKQIAGVANEDYATPFSEKLSVVMYNNYITSKVRYQAIPGLFNNIIKNGLFYDQDLKIAPEVYTTRIAGGVRIDHEQGYDTLQEAQDAAFDKSEQYYSKFQAIWSSQPSFPGAQADLGSMVKTLFIDKEPGATGQYFLTQPDEELYFENVALFETKIVGSGSLSLQYYLTNEYFPYNYKVDRWWKLSTVDKQKELKKWVRTITGIRLYDNQGDPIIDSTSGLELRDIFSDMPLYLMVPKSTKDQNKYQPLGINYKEWKNARGLSGGYVLDYSIMLPSEDGTGDPNGMLDGWGKCVYKNIYFDTNRLDRTPAWYRKKNLNGVYVEDLNGEKFTTYGYRVLHYKDQQIIDPEWTDEKKNDYYTYSSDAFPKLALGNWVSDENLDDIVAGIEPLLYNNFKLDLEQKEDDHATRFFIGHVGPDNYIKDEPGYYYYENPALNIITPADLTEGANDAYAVEVYRKVRDFYMKIISDVAPDDYQARGENYDPATATEDLLIYDKNATYTEPSVGLIAKVKKNEPMYVGASNKNIIGHTDNRYKYVDTSANGVDYNKIGAITNGVDSIGA